MYNTLRLHGSPANASVTALVGRSSWFLIFATYQILIAYSQLLQTPSRIPTHIQCLGGSCAHQAVYVRNLTRSFSPRLNPKSEGGKRGQWMRSRRWYQQVETISATVSHIEHPLLSQSNQ